MAGRNGTLDVVASVDEAHDCAAVLSRADLPILVASLVRDVMIGVVQGLLVAFAVVWLVRGFV